jgi:CRISPR-associated protein Cas6
MANDVNEMVDIAFHLGGVTPPGSYPFALWDEIVRLVPELQGWRQAGILPLQLGTGSVGMQLQKRAKLVMRLPVENSALTTSRLSGQHLAVDGILMRLGQAQQRDIKAYPTIHAHMVAGVADELQFMEDIKRQMDGLGVSGNLICGRLHRLVSDRQSITGFSLVIHDLKPEHSVRLQYAGLGEARRYGCGIFIPYKMISGLNED